MSIETQKITTCLWFNTEVEDAARFYTSVFKNSKINKVNHLGPDGMIIVDFELEGKSFTGFNGGPEFKFTEAISLVVHCDNQQEIDYYWETLSEGGDPNSQQCGWLKDKFGLSWQIIPKGIETLLSSPPAFQALLQMKKLDIEKLQQAGKE